MPTGTSEPHRQSELIIDERRNPGLQATLGGPWQLVTDQVMGGLSDGQLTSDHYQGQDCLRLQGDISLANRGGFIQMAMDLAGGAAFDASAYQGITLRVAGNREEYNLHLRTTDLQHPWQSYRVSLTALPEWQEISLPFASFQPHRTEHPLRTDRLRRLGLVAIGRSFSCDLRLARLALYRE